MRNSLPDIIRVYMYQMFNTICLFISILQIQIVRRTFWTKPEAESCLGNSDETDSAFEPIVDCSDQCNLLNENTRCTDSSTKLNWITGERILYYMASSFHAS